jgi:hypothetical protein
MSPDPVIFSPSCFVRVTETLPDPVILTTDCDFLIYRRHSRQIGSLYDAILITRYSYLAHVLSNANTRFRS